jgi:O-acetyl-ADP-ribose deacetylase (regulator of RNase III)
MVNYIEGDLIELAKQGAFDVIAHGCNCRSAMGAGIAPQIAKAFGCDKFEMERLGTDMNKLGNIDYKTFVLGVNGAIWSIEDGWNRQREPELVVVNAYTQFNYGRNHEDGDEVPFSYEAFRLCMRKINYRFQKKHIGLPKIGAGLAGGNWLLISRIIEEELKDCKVTIVNYKK